jgi:hypothetical protein
MDRRSSHRPLLGSVTGTKAVHARASARGEKVERVEGFRSYLDNQALDMRHTDVIRFYVSTHINIGAAVQNFFKVENALGAFRGNKERWRRARSRLLGKASSPSPRDQASVSI